MKQVKLGEIATIYNGNSINQSVKNQKYMNDVPGWNYIATKDVGVDGKITYQNGVIIPYSEKGFRIAPAGSVFVCSEGGSAGKKTAVLQEDVCFGNKLFAIVNDKGLYNEKYLFYYTRFERFREQFKLLATSLMGGISVKNFSAIKVPLCSLQDQHRIVSRIEELFSQLDSGVETLKKTKEQLKVYRQAVLKEAFSHINEYNIIRNVSTLVTSGSRGWAKYYSNSGAIFVRIGNLTRTGIDIDFKDTQFVELPDKAEGVRSKLLPNDVLVSITADLGSIGLVPDNIDEAYINQHIALVRFNNPNQGKFMAYYLRSDYGQKELLKNKRGAGKLGLGLDDIRDSRVPIVTDDMASSIVAEIESRLSVCDSIEKTIDTALQEAEALRQSILKQAFEGGL
ncbi:MAG TPA: restriction endonuclease subunit S [Ruminococcus sp.]|nr:restriction endonuclease subunit S [Ruminococcus sp.]